LKSDAAQRIAAIDRKQQAMREKLDRLDQAFLFEWSIDIDTYDRHRDKLREELTLAQMDRHTTELEELDVEGILVFAERVLPSASNFWVQPPLAQKQRLQQVFFQTECASAEKACWNRHNPAGFQLLESCFGRKKRFGGPDGNRTAASNGRRWRRITRE
jgi:hypothetical protein